MISNKEELHEYLQYEKERYGSHTSLYIICWEVRKLLYGLIKKDLEKLNIIIIQIKKFDVLLAKLYYIKNRINMDLIFG